MRRRSSGRVTGKKSSAGSSRAGSRCGPIAARPALRNRPSIGGDGSWHGAAGRARIVAHHDAVRPRASRGDRSREALLIAAGFLPVQVTADRRPEGGRGVELLLADGRVLRLHLGFDRQTLLDVLGVLEGRGC